MLSALRTPHIRLSDCAEPWPLCAHSFPARQPANAMTGAERADEMLLLCEHTPPLDLFYERVQELVGSPVSWADIAFSFETLIEEARKR